MEVVDAHANLALNLQLATFDFHRLDSRWGLSDDILAELGECVGGKELFERTGLRELPESLEVTRILVHRDVDNAIQDGDNFVFTFEAFFELNVLIPEGMGEEIEANAVGTTFEEPAGEG